MVRNVNKTVTKQLVKQSNIWSSYYHVSVNKIVSLCLAQRSSSIVSYVQNIVKFAQK